MPRPVRFDIHAADPARGGAWESWLIGTGPKEEPGIDGGMMQSDPSAK